MSLQSWVAFLQSRIWILQFGWATNMTNTTTIIAAAIVAIIVIAFIIIRMKKAGGKSAFVNNQVYVGNIPYHVKDYELKKFFGQFGAVRQTRVVKNTRTGRSKGFAFITFANARDANQALTANGQDMKGRSMVVRIAKPPRHE